MEKYIIKRNSIMINRLLDFLETSYTAYHAVENAKQLLLGNGFIALSETDDWAIEEGGKYFVERNGSSLPYRAVRSQGNNCLPAQNVSDDFA